MQQKTILITDLKCWLTAQPAIMQVYPQKVGYLGFFSFSKPDMFLGELVKHNDNVMVFETAEAALIASERAANTKLGYNI